MKKIYSIDWDKEGIFLERPNRFVGRVDVEELGEELIHIHDTGRIKEILYPGNKVKIRRAKNENRKTKWDLISGRGSNGEEVLLNSGIHRYIAESIFKDGGISPFGSVPEIKAEVKYGKSRLDFKLKDEDDRDIWVEVKGVSLTVDEVAMFPDAPSVRAVKHLKELIELSESGSRAGVVLLIFRKSKYFRPKYETDMDFTKTLYEAMEKGVEVYPLQLEYNGSEIVYHKVLKIMSKEDLDNEILSLDKN